MDGYDAFSAGVEPGGLRNRNEIKVLIAFLLKNTERGLSRRQLMEVIQREGLANYFEASQALESLIEGGSVEVDKSDDDELLSLTAAGKTAANIEDELPRAVRDKALATEAASKACRLFDKAVSKGIIHKNQAANRKSGVMALANSLDK